MHSQPLELAPSWAAPSVQGGADISQCIRAWRCVSPTGSLFADWTVRPRGPWTRNLRTEKLEASVGPGQTLSCTSVVMDQLQVSSFGVKAPEGRALHRSPLYLCNLRTFLRPGNCNLSTMKALLGMLLSALPYLAPLHCTPASWCCRTDLRIIASSSSCLYALGASVNKKVLFACHKTESFQKLKNKCTTCSGS